MQWEQISASTVQLIRWIRIVDYTPYNAELMVCDSVIMMTDAAVVAATDGDADWLM